MIGGNRILGLITARGGSKGVLRKNIKPLAGKPLIGWTIEAAKKSKYMDCVILSSEDEEIISVALSYGCEVPFIRPHELALDETPGIEPVLHAINIMSGYDYVVLLQPTSPFRNDYDIDTCIEFCINNMLSSCVSVCLTDKSPYWLYEVDQIGKMKPFFEIADRSARRQDLPSAYTLNGSIYIANIPWLLMHKTFLHPDTGAFIMPKERSYDIDTPMDFAIAEYLMLHS